MQRKGPILTFMTNQDTPSKSTSPNILLASQGIYDRQQRMFGTELLFRNDKGHTINDISEATATSEVLVNHCGSITDEIEHLKRPAFINVTADFLLSEAFLPIDPDFLFIELVERITVTPEVVKAVKAWKKRGFRFALDDFEFGDSWAPLLEMADVVKIDVLGQDPDEIFRRKTALHDAYDCRWLAERIETEKEFKLYLDQGFDLFQGYFLSRPKLIKGTAIRPEQASAAEIIRVTASEESTIESVAQAIERDPALSLQVLKIINSPLYSLNRPVESLKDAVVFLGMSHIRKWAMVLSLLTSSDTCTESQRLVLCRAKFCELYSEVLGVKETDRAFVVGLLSGIDILFGVETASFMEKIHLSKDIHSAVLLREGKLGKVLTVAINLEKVINLRPDKLAASKQNVLDSYHDAFIWTEEILGRLR